MKPEDLKRLAEYAGKNDVRICGRRVEFSIRKVDCLDILYSVEYDPLTNAEQCLELVRKLRISLLQADDIPITAYLDKGEKYYSATGKTINEAVTLAAIAALK